MSAPTTLTPKGTTKLLDAIDTGALKAHREDGRLVIELDDLRTFLADEAAA